MNAMNDIYIDRSDTSVSKIHEVVVAANEQKIAIFYGETPEEAEKLATQFIDQSSGVKQVFETSEVDKLYELLSKIRSRNAKDRPTYSMCTEALRIVHPQPSEE